MTPLASHFWSAGVPAPGTTFGVALVGVVVGLGVGYLIHRMTAAGAHLPPADGAEVAADVPASAGPDRAAPAPGAPVGRAGAPGVTPLPDPDPYDQDAEQVAAALLGQPLPCDDDEVEQVVAQALDCLANAQILREQGDDAPAQRWEDQAREILADDLNPAELIEVLLPYLCEVAEVRAGVLLAGVERVAGGGR